MKFAKLFVVLAVFSLTFAAAQAVVASESAPVQGTDEKPSEPTKPAEPKPAEPK